MDQNAFNAHCKALAHTTHVVQWNGADVWKVGGKVFAISGWHHGEHSGITFKASDLAFEVLRDAPGYRPAPYFASRGMKWIQCFEDGPDDAELGGHIDDSYRLVGQGLTKKKRQELGFEA